MKRFKLIIIIAAAAAIGLAGCAGESSAEQAINDNTATKTDKEVQEPIEIPGTASTFSTDFTRYSINADEVLSGGPPKDGIPAVTDPEFVSVDDASAWIGAAEPVIMVIKGELKKAYPLQILMFHEIVNDTIDGMPVAVTYCPLCNTSVVFKAEVDGRRLDFGTTGRLRFSNLLMYDRQTESWWQQASGTGVIGTYTGTELEIYPSIILSFSELQNLHPDAAVQTKNTGYGRPYGENPYVGYDSGSPWAYRNGPALPEGVDPMERAVMVRIGGEEKVLRYEEVEKEGLITDTLGGAEIAAIWGPGVASPLDTREIRSGRDVGNVNVFYQNTATRDLELYFDNGVMKDRETGSAFNAAGLGTDGPLKGEQLIPAPAIQHFWFSAYVFSNLGL